MFLLLVVAVRQLFAFVPIPFDVYNHLVFSAKLCILPFCPPIVISNRSLELFTQPDTYSLQHLKLNEEKELVWMTGFDEKSQNIVISFRGSYTKSNWAQNLNMKFKVVEGPDLKDVKIHQGWLGGITRTLPKLKTDVNALLDINPNAGILFAGHSSGASYSVIAAFLSSVEGGFLHGRVNTSRIQIAVFGGPRVGNAAFAHKFDKMGWRSVYRVVKGNDPAPYWPPEKFPFNYRHHGLQEVYINSNHDDKTPVFCNEQPKTLEAGGCFNRNEFLEVNDDPFRFDHQHLEYMGIHLGSYNCKFTIR